MADKRKMEVKITTKDDTRKGTRSAESNFDRVAKSAKNVGIAAAGAAIALGSMVVAKSLKAWAIQEQAILQVEKRLKSTGAAAWTSSKQLQAMASSLQTMTVFGDEAILQMQSLLLTFKDIQGPIFERSTRAILDMASALAQSTGGEPDLRSAATMVGKALQDPVLGLTAMSRAGIQFSDSQKDVIKNLVETNQKAEAQVIILKELETQFGGAAGAVGLSGAVKQAQNAFGDLFEEFGKGLTATGEIEGSLKSLTDYMGDSQTKQDISEFGEAMAALGGGLIEIEKIAFKIAKKNPFLLIFKGAGKLQEAIKVGARAALGGPDIGAIPTLGGVAGAITGADIPAGLGGPGFSALALGGIGGAPEIGFGGEALSPQAAARQKEHDQFLLNLTTESEAFAFSLLSQEEQLDISFQNKQDKLDEFLQNNIISQQDHDAFSLGLEEERQDKRTSAARKGDRDRQRNAMNSLRGVGAFADNIFGAMANSAEAGSRKEFNANKNRAIGSAIVNTAQGATKAFSQWGWPWGAVAAAAVVAAGLTQVNKIRSQEFGGGGGGDTGTFAAQAPVIDTGIAPVTQPQPVGTNVQQGATYNIQVFGTVVDRTLDQFARELTTPLEQAKLDGVEEQTF